MVCKVAIVIDSVMFSLDIYLLLIVLDFRYFEFSTYSLVSKDSKEIEIL